MRGTRVKNKTGPYVPNKASPGRLGKSVANDVCLDILPSALPKQDLASRVGHAAAS
jgi:hypothetical protein